jgi:hypothetical protein
MPIKWAFLKTVNFRVTVLGEQCDVKDGGEWDPKW